MDTATAFAMGRANRHRPIKVFDWIKAAKLIRGRRPREAVAGLAGDMEHTGGTIWRYDAPDTDSYTYLASTWATPVLVMDDDEIDCWTTEESGWDAETKWPEAALAILAAP